ncbi:MAG: beta-N-acetylhexosaminidase [Moraxella sp.]|nr:beta-N-acetylhexosaminidase [Moraxella sp.]
MHATCPNTPIIPSLMIDVDGTSLNADDVKLLGCDEIAGVILFKRNVATPAQVRALTDSMRAVNPTLVIAADQEGGRVARFRDGFSPLPAMGRLGKLYDDNATAALSLAYDTGYLMAAEVLAVGVDISFAPVLDIDGGSSVIGDRAFHTDPSIASMLVRAFMSGMHAVGMKTTGKHFPGHGSVLADSHISDVCDERCFDDIWQDVKVFIDNLNELDALMPAHVVFAQVDDKPAGFSKIWLQDILRGELGYTGVLFSDDLSMKAAHVAGGVGERVLSAIMAGCDVALVCNDRAGAWQALHTLQSRQASPNAARFHRMKSAIPTWLGELETTCQQFDYYQTAKDNVTQAFFVSADNPRRQVSTDPTAYRL